MLIPSIVDTDELTTQFYSNLTEDSSTTRRISTSETSPITTLALIDQAQIHNELPTRRTPIVRTRNRTTNSQPTVKPSTNHWLESYYQTRTSTERMSINYTDRAKLDLCEGFYDAITMYKGILFIFKGQVRASRPGETIDRTLSSSSSSIFGNMIDAVSIRFLR